MFPVAFALMPNRQRATYTKLFEQLKNAVLTTTGADLDPPTIQTDFELPAIQAIETAFPNTNLRGCLFHYSQCILRKIQTIGLVQQYREDPAVQVVARRAACVPLLPLHQVQDAWVEVLNDRPDIPLVRLRHEYLGR